MLTSTIVALNEPASGSLAFDSKCNRNRSRDCFWHWAGGCRRVRFDFAVAEHCTLPRRTDTCDLRCAVAAECFYMAPVNCGEVTFSFCPASPSPPHQILL